MLGSRGVRLAACGVFAVGCLMVAPLAGSADPRGIETMSFSFNVVRAFERDAAVSGELRIPASPPDRLPAVVILHSSPGFDGRGAFYAEALNQAGIATVEIDYLRGRGMPATPRHNLPHAYETLQYLAGHPRIDPARIGVMGFSWGGILAVLTSSEELTREYAEGALRFAAHLALYPICWKHHAVLAGRPGQWTDLRPSVYQRVTGRPVHILAGDRDDYEDPDSCQRFLAALPAPVRANFSQTVYRGATFGWDSRFSSAVYDRGAKKGAGGIVNVVADAEIASRSRAFAVTYFRTVLAADRREAPSAYRYVWSGSRPRR